MAIAGSANNICAGVNVIFTATPVNGGAIPVYQWQLNGSNAGTNSPTFSSTSLVNNDIVTCVLKSSDACAIPPKDTSNQVIMVVHQPPTPVLTSNSPVCEGGQLIVSATAVTGITYSIQSQTGFGSANYIYTKDAVFDNVTSAYASQWYATSMDTYGCISPVSAYLPVVINPGGKDSVSIAGSANAICTGVNVTFAATPVNGGAIPVYQWQLNGSNAGTNSPTFSSTTLVNNDVVTCVMTTSNTCASPSKVTSDPITMVVHQPPTPVLTSNSPVCEGGQLIVSATAVTGITYSIQSQTGFGSASYIYTKDAVFDNVTSAYASQWYATSMDTYGCISAVSAYLPVVINPSGKDSVSIAASAVNICSNTAVTFTATPVNGGTSPLYQWKLNGQNAGTNSATYSNSALANNDQISCVLTSNAACLTQSTATSNIITMTVQSGTAPSFTAIGPYCLNAVAPDLPPQSSNGISGTWKPAAVNTSVVGQATYTFTPSGGSCTAPVPVVITILPAGATPTFAAIGPYCQNAVAPDLPPQSSNGISGKWSPSSLSTATPGTITYTFTPDASQCGVSSPVNVDIKITPLPIVKTGPDQTITAGETVGLTATVTGISQAEIQSYQWSPPDGLSSSSIAEPQASPAATTIYTLTVTSDAGCKASNSTTINVQARVLPPLGIPNAFSPNGDGVNDTWVITNISYYPDAQVSVFNRYGHLIYQTQGAYTPWDGNYDGKKVPFGTYYYIIDTKKNTKKISGSLIILR